MAALAAEVSHLPILKVKLKGAGDLERMRAVRAARDAGLGIMVGCMVGTSPAMAPAMLVAQRARYVDLDGPLLLACDREPGLIYREGALAPAAAALWG
jgi:L-alanine-DL-glutamate epimerase-like enolase superfamily enzyme